MGEAMSHRESWQLSPAASQMKTCCKEKSDEAAITVVLLFLLQSTPRRTETYSVPRGRRKSHSKFVQVSLTTQLRSVKIFPARYFFWSLAAVA